MNWLSDAAIIIDVIKYVRNQYGHDKKWYQMDVMKIKNGQVNIK